jgi:PadR family transcriptional regulator, regulatory protein PadR
MVSPNGFEMTLQTQAVLRVMLDHPLQEHYGLEISKAAGLPSGSLYPILARLERAGWISSDWEQVDAHEAGRPRRRYYTLTPDGAEMAEQALAATLKRLSPQPRSSRRSSFIPEDGQWRDRQRRFVDAPARVASTGPSRTCCWPSRGAL